MDFVKQTSTLRDIIDGELQKMCEPDGMAGYANVPAQLRDIMRYAFLTGGKRFRPVLCLAACRAVSGSHDAALAPALAIEALHTYTLVHDDLPCMDNDLLRRGMPTVHAKFGEAEAVLTGDALQALAFELITKTPTSAEVTLRIMREFVAAAGAGGVIGGQWVDVTSTPPHDAARVAYVHEHKTADLIRCALVMGGIAGGGTETEVEALRAFGLNIGLAFQIIDDLLDSEDEAKADEMGILQVLDKDAATARCKELTARAEAALAVLDSSDPTRAEAVALLRRLAEEQISRTV